MAYEDPNAPSSAPASTTTPAATPAPATTEKKSGSWDWLWPSILAVIIVKLFGLVGGLVAFGSYYWLKPKLGTWGRSEEHTSELQSLMRTSYAVFCLKKKTYISKITQLTPVTG